MLVSRWIICVGLLLRMGAPPKMEGFVWKLVQHRIPSSVELAKIGVSNLESTVRLLSGESRKE
ncbi:hypothetical protein F3Y22_tig00116976pilonHSYRG00001 [Hibiscus syriacus]|uniref:Reverse transcriptase zinc-binding domain-containing protein n=1 Tax=Hibiscus syriacus TaxID=106335 RepID=A0A6A2XHF4_HIBSY|nr:hypothetical protein F3Y22_tig00116976pilonHSYRG00001 [Hibiscus syriacus]